MKKKAIKTRYGYQVTHLVLAGLALGLVFLAAGFALIAMTSLSKWHVSAATACIMIGLGVLAYSIGLRWLAVRGRPLLTERMLNTITWSGTEKALDIGCGPGLTLVGVAKRLTTGKVIGIDKWMVIHGERHNSKDITLENVHLEGVADRVEVRDGDAASLPFADDSFDVVVSGFVFHHMQRGVRSLAIREVVRVTKPDGRILIADNSTTLELGAALTELGLTSVSIQRLTFPIRLLSARKAGRAGMGI